MLSMEEILPRVEKAIAKQMRLFRDPWDLPEHIAVYIPETRPTDFDPEDLAQTLREQAIRHALQLSRRPEWIDLSVIRWTQNWCRTLARRAKADARKPWFFDDLPEQEIGWGYAVGASNDSDDLWASIVDSREEIRAVQMGRADTLDVEIAVRIREHFQAPKPPDDENRHVLESVIREAALPKPGGRVCGRCGLKLKKGRYARRDYVEHRDCTCHLSGKA